tara:strand:- start:4581 stop:5105 length:525 start_codon:yes stop_codon:yes gene_type:complete
MSSNALSSAKKRRAANNSNNDINNNTMNNNNNMNTSTSSKPSNALSLQNVITTLNTRLTKLENSTNVETVDKTDLDISEINTRFDILVNEINEIKDMLLKLQTFTMEVNKSLFDERINILSDNTEPITLNIEEDTLLNENNIEQQIQQINETIENENIVNQDNIDGIEGEEVVE